MNKEVMVERTKEVFNKSVSVIIDDLGLANIALSVFSERNIIYVTEKPPIMSLCLTGRGEYLWKINVTNCYTLHPNEFAFIILHECLHYILKHIQIGHLLRNRVARNIAADMIVNDLLVEVIKESEVNENFYDQFQYSFYSGINTIGVNTCEMTLEEVYKKVMLLPTPPEELSSQLDNHEEHDPDSPNVENASDRLIDSFTNNNNNPPEINQQDIERRGAGTGVNRQGHQLIGLARAIFNFSKVFFKLTGKKLMRGTDDDIGNSWVRRPRAMISLNPNNGMLPGTMMEPQKKHRIDLFIDVSGSVTDEQCQFFANFVNLIPRSKWIVHVHSFNTEVHNDIEIDSKGKIVSLKTGGGTDFSAINRFILTAAPIIDNICVVSDGEDKLDPSSVKDPDKWTWIIDNPSRFREISLQLPGKVFSMNSITKELRR